MNNRSIAYIWTPEMRRVFINKWLVPNGSVVRRNQPVVEIHVVGSGRMVINANQSGNLIWAIDGGEVNSNIRICGVILANENERFEEDLNFAELEDKNIYYMRAVENGIIILKWLVPEYSVVKRGQRIMQAYMPSNSIESSKDIVAPRDGCLIRIAHESENRIGFSLPLKNKDICAIILTNIENENPNLIVDTVKTESSVIRNELNTAKTEAYFTQKELDVVKNELDKTIKELDEAKTEVGISKKEFDTIKSQLINEFISENLLLNNEDGRSNHSYDRTLFDEMTARLNMIERERDNLQRQKYISELHQWVNEAKRHADEAKTQREWQSAEQSQYKAEIYQVKTDFDSKLREEELKRDREELKREKQDFKIEKVATQFDVQRQQMMVDFGRMQNELSAVGLSLKDFVMQKVFEFKTYEMNVKEHILKMGDMINWVNAKSLETERSKIQVMEGLAQMGLALKEHETYLERTLLGADRLKLDADRQNLLNERQSNEVVLMMEKFNLEYGSKRNELENLILQVKEGQFNNHAKSSMMEMDAKVLDIQTQLKGLAFEQVGMDVFFREGQMRLSEKEGQIAMKKLQIEQNVNELKYLRQVGRLENQVETEKLKSAQRESRLQDEIGHLQNQVDKESMRAEYLRQTMRFLNTRY